MSLPSQEPLKLTSFSHGGGCGCKIAPGVLAEILKKSSGFPVPKELMVGIETADDAAVYKLNDEQALIATTDFFMPIVDDPFDFGRIAATNAISDVYAMGGTPIMALALVGMPINKLPLDTIGKIIQGGESICAEAGIPIAGGHTIDSVEPIYGLVVMGLVHPSKVKRNADARAEGYAAMIANTTKLNKPGKTLAQLDGVHAMTDVTGFGLLGHLLELARGAQLSAELEMARIPLLPGVLDLTRAGYFTGASGRNWDAYGHDVELGTEVDDTARLLLTDPQTSGGLLVSCAPDSVDEVLALFAREGFGEAAVIGRMVEGAARAIVR
jgi:selenide,water dikinase